LEVVALAFTKEFLNFRFEGKNVEDSFEATKSKII